MKTLFIATLLGCSLIGSAAVAERPRYVVLTETIRTDDLNLATATGAREMFRRIQGAAGAACYQTRSDVFPWATYEVNRCTRRTIARAVGELGAPLVTAAFERWNGAPPRQTAAR